MSKPDGAFPFFSFSPQYDKNDASVLSMNLGLWLPDCFLVQLGTCTSGIGLARALRFAQTLVSSQEAVWQPQHQMHT
jgi:hypothetical protein